MTGARIGSGALGAGKLLEELIARSLEPLGQQSPRLARHGTHLASLGLDSSNLFDCGTTASLFVDTCAHRVCGQRFAPPACEDFCRRLTGVFAV